MLLSFSLEVSCVCVRNRMSMLFGSAVSQSSMLQILLATWISSSERDICSNPFSNFLPIYLFLPLCPKSSLFWIIVFVKYITSIFPYSVCYNFTFFWESFEKCKSFKFGEIQHMFFSLFLSFLYLMLYHKNTGKIVKIFSKEFFSFDS